MTALLVSGIVLGKRRGEDRYALWIDGDGYLIVDLYAGLWPDRGARLEGIVRTSRDPQTVRDATAGRSLRVRIVRGGLSHAEAKQILSAPVPPGQSEAPTPRASRPK